MYIRTTRSGGRTYLQLVEGFREDGVVRQRIVANLGRLDQLSAKKLSPLICGLQRAVGLPTAPALAPCATVAGSVSAPEFDAALAFGDVYALNELWVSLGFRDVITRALRSSKRKFDAEALVRALVFNRLCAPDSKLGCLDWLQTTAIPGMPEVVTHDQLLRTMDALMDRAEAVETQVAAQLKPMLDQQLSVVFYDLTTIRIHGEAELPNDIRQYGLNKETGGVARQFVLGVVQSAEGLPLMHTVHAGNVSEAKTLKAMLDLVLKRFAVERVIVVADRGLLSVDNVKELTDLGVSSGRKLQFILAVPARRYRELGGTLDGLDWAGADGTVTTKSASESNPEPCPEPSPEPSPEPNAKKRQERLAEGAFLGHRLIVSHDPTGAAAQSVKRRARIKELTNFAETLVKKLDAQDALAEKKASAKKVRVSKARAKNGAVQNDTTADTQAAEVLAEKGRKASDRGAYSRFRKAVSEAKLTRFIKADFHADRFSYDVNELAVESAERFDGKLVLLSNVPDFSAEKILERYKALADIERGFRVLKSDLEIAPVFHRLPDRIRAHALICFLALVMYRVMRMRLKASGSTHSPKTTLEVLHQLQKHRVRVGTQTLSGIGKINPTQLELFAALAVQKPD